MHAIYPSIFREGARLLLPIFKQLVLITVIQCEVRLKVTLYSILFIRTGIVGPFCIVQSTYFLSVSFIVGICGSHNIQINVCHGTKNKLNLINTTWNSLLPSLVLVHGAEVLELSGDSCGWSETGHMMSQIMLWTFTFHSLSSF